MVEENHKLMVYVAGPLTNGMKNIEDSFVEGNIDQACRVANFIRSKGIVPYIPHLTWYWQKRNPEIVYDEWLEMCETVLSRCDALYRLDGVSKGADYECELAHDLGIPVFTVLAQLLEWKAMERRAKP